MTKPKITNIGKKNPKWANRLWAALIATGVAIAGFGFVNDNSIIQYTAFGMVAVGTFFSNLFKEGDQ